MYVRHEWNFNCLQWSKHSLLTYLGPVAGTFGHVVTLLYCLLSKLIEEWHQWHGDGGGVSYGTVSDLCLLGTSLTVSENPSAS